MHAFGRMRANTSENISVAVRLRDVGTAAEPLAWKISPAGNELSLVDDKALQESTAQARGKHSAKAFRFNAVFPGNSSTRDVYRLTVQPIVHSALDGINGCVLAFGSTGSGKTYTMVGDSIACQGGVVTLALGDVFAEAGKRSSTHDVTVTATMVELYDEQITDLFAAQGSSYQPPVQIVVRFCSRQD
jgi:Kinesin motor domain